MLMINCGPLCFKLDTGASVTAIPESEYTQDRYGNHSAPLRPLLGPANKPLDVIGQVYAVIQRGDRKIEEEVFIVKHLTTPLLGLPAIRRLQRIPQLHNINDAETFFRSTYPDMFTENRIKLKDTATSYALSVPRLAIPLWWESERGGRSDGEDGVIARVMEPTECLTKTESRYAQIEKEPLAVTWACENLQGYLSSLDFTIQTDHKPLITLLKSRALDDLPPRILRFRLRLLRFTFNIIHVLGKNLITADTLSRAPLLATATEAEQDLEKECKAYIDSVVDSLPATQTKLTQIKDAQHTDNTCIRLRRHITNGWPKHRRDVHELMLPYCPEQSSMHEGGGLLMKGVRLIIPEHMRTDILQKLHQGHQGINKCLVRVREAVWWPGITSQVKQMVERCEICAREAQIPVKPLLNTELPSRPWQRVGADIFQWRNGNYLVLVYFSQYIEVCTLSGGTSAKQMIARFKAAFARYGCPEVLVTDNGPQCSCHDFAHFARDYDFTHVTSSPRYPHSNGEAERAVRTVKSLLDKEGDFHKALLAYRAIPLAHGSSPAQLLMGRRIRTPVPVTPGQLQPQWPELEIFREKDAAMKLHQEQNFNQRHRAQNLPPFSLDSRYGLIHRHQRDCCGSSTHTMLV
ncbi:hypothetical protein LDENG_00184290 [Lucifuga dentata]|nr:hypothetical protein LDENG_00184290 [Lucifuga dentata]